MKSRAKPSSDEWFYKESGETCGPVSTGRLEELLAAGRLRPDQAVWRRHLQCLLFIQAARAASEAAGGGSRRPGSGPAPA